MVVHDRTRLIAGSCFLTYQMGTDPVRGLSLYPVAVFYISRLTPGRERILDMALRKLPENPEMSPTGDLYIRKNREIDLKLLIYSSN